MSDQDSPSPTGTPPLLTGILGARFPDALLSHHCQHGDETVVVQAGGMLELCAFLREDGQCLMDMMIDLTAVDLLPQSPRFELVIHLKSIALGHRLRLKVPLEADEPEVDSITGIWVAADWYERECFEMYGIRFKGHPNLKKLLLYEGFQGYPLRKDYEKGLAQPLVPLRTVRERYSYGETFMPVAGIEESEVS